MGTIYLVSDGAYSDYRVLGTYSTRALAEQAVQLYAANNEIEEFALDALPEHPPGLFAYNVHMLRDGNVRQCDRVSVDGHREEWAPYYYSHSGVLFRVWARDPEHAVKIANERRAGLIASGEWTEDWNHWKSRR